MTAKASSSKAVKAVKSLKSPKTPKVDKLTKAIKTKEGKANARLQTGLDPALVGKAVEALLKYHEKQSEKTDKLSMLGNDQPVQVQFALLRAPAHTTPKPIRVLVPHPLFKLADKEGDSDEMEEPEICLIVKEESKAWVQEMLAKFPDHMGCVKKVLGLQSLRTKHARYEQRRELLNKYNFFMADDRILPMLSKALGKDFFHAKKLPIPISLTRKAALPFAIQKALSATYMTVSTGTCIMIRAGHTGMSPEKLAANIVEIAKNAVPKIPHKWANVQVISIKTPESVALPVYNKTPEALKELAKLAGLEEDIEPAEKEKSEEEKKKDEDEAANSKKRDMKSPLLRALKKQKQKETKKLKYKAAKKETKMKAEEAEKEGAKKQESKSIEKAEDEKMVEKKETPKKRRASSEGSAKEKGSAKKNKAETPESSKKAAKKGDDVKVVEKKETPKEKKRRTSSEGPAKEEKGSAKKKKAETPESSKKAATKKKEDDDGEKKDFHAVAKFKGSKKGYVFKKGPQGLGYYVDILPTVDKMKIEAIMRSTRNSGGRGGQKKSQRKGGRR